MSNEIEIENNNIKNINKDGEVTIGVSGDGIFGATVGK